MALKVEKVEKEILISELISLEHELSGVDTTRKDGEKILIKGVISQDLLASVKVHLFPLLEKIGSETNNFYKVRDELVKKYGKKSVSDDGVDSYDLSGNFEKYKLEEADLLEQKITITFPLFSIDDLLSFNSSHSFYYTAKYLTYDFDS
jgi:hypothetical protein